MGSHSERHLFGLVVIVSLALTGLTVWSVVMQGRALRQRAITRLKSQATTAATQRTAALQTATDRAFDAGRELWRTSNADGLDAWLTTRPEWLLALASHGPGAVQAFPRTALELELPLPDSQPATQEASPTTLLRMLREWQNWATNPDPLARAGVLVALAGLEQRLGNPAAAARHAAEAVQVLRSTPGLREYALRADLTRVEALLHAGDQPAAAAAIGELLVELQQQPGSRIGPVELARLNELATLTGATADPLVRDALAILREGVEQREAILSAARQALENWARGSISAAAGDRAVFLECATRDGLPLVLSVRRSDGLVLALVANAKEFVRHHWHSDATTQWQARLPADRTSRLVLAHLGPEFAGAVLEPTPAVAADLDEAIEQQLEVVVVTGSSMVIAWALVIWMMYRVVERQRELRRLQSRFVADVSHELRTPLALIRLLSETLADQRVRDPERVHAYHETITRESERLTVLLDNILDLGRIESGRKKYQFGECQVAAVARQAWALFEPQFTSEGFDARLEAEADLPAIQADAQALQQVLVNLLQNAYRYASEGKFVRLRVARQGFTIVLSVEDHGIGMSRAQLQRLGESFFRADDARVRQTRGAGLGLAICNHIVTAHHGKIEVDSDPGRGSRFTVWIPFEPPGGGTGSEPRSQPAREPATAPTREAGAAAGPRNAAV